jgi:hypothetical protein
MTVTLRATGLAVPDLDWVVTSYSGHRAHEGIAYTASLTWKGLGVGAIENAGEGGGENVYWNGSDYSRRARDVWPTFCAAVPKDSLVKLLDLEAERFVNPSLTPAALDSMDEETVALLLVEEFLVAKRFNGYVRRGKTVFLAPGEDLYPGSGFRVVNAAGEEAFTWLRSKYGADPRVRVWYPPSGGWAWLHEAAAAALAGAGR